MFWIIISPVENLPRKIEIDTIDMPIGKSIKGKETATEETPPVKSSTKQIF